MVGDVSVPFGMNGVVCAGFRCTAGGWWPAVCVMWAALVRVALSSAGCSWTGVFLIHMNRFCSLMVFSVHIWCVCSAFGERER